MTERTMTEKDMFLQSLERETKTTLKLLRAYPQAKADLKPSEKSRTARELAWVFAMEHGVIDMALKGKIDFSGQMPAPPAELSAIAAALEQATRDTVAKVTKASEDELNQTVKFPTGPGAMSDLRRFDVLWTVLMDQVHHRGQFSVYLRLAGAKVPSIYGPTADETWM